MITCRMQTYGRCLFFQLNKRITTTYIHVQCRMKLKYVFNVYIYIHTCKSLVGSIPQNQPQSARWITLSLSLCNSTLILPRMDDREDKVWWNTPREKKPGRNKATNQPTTNKTAEPTMRFTFPNLYFLVAKLLVKKQ